ncbi:MAG: hypothetical protein J5892_00810 [Bacilli bacterium]|nr:hypothetical protein [Bacilli bacterium]
MKKSLGLLLALVMLFGGVIVARAEEDDLAGGTTGAADTTTSTYTGEDDLSDCDEVCQRTRELSTEKTNNPKTGSFVPYAIVIGGIVFSISAIALAKKNNKLYQV